MTEQDRFEAWATMRFRGRRLSTNTDDRAIEDAIDFAREGWEARAQADSQAPVAQDPAEQESLRDMLEDARAEQAEIRAALGVPYEPHQSLHERTLDAARAGRTPGAQWREQGKADPHGIDYDCERAALALGTLTDDELANGAFMNYDRPMDIERVLRRDPEYHTPIVWMTAVKERIRWLSRALEGELGIRRRAVVKELLCRPYPDPEHVLSALAQIGVTVTREEACNVGSHIGKRSNGAVGEAFDRGDMRKMFPVGPALIEASQWCKSMERPKSVCGCPDCGSSLIDYQE